MRTNALVEAIQSLWRIAQLRHVSSYPAPDRFLCRLAADLSPSAILAEAGLSFFGLGDPSIPNVGADSEAGFRTGGVYVGYWWWIVPPGLLIVLDCTDLYVALVGAGAGGQSSVAAQPVKNFSSCTR
ncbi:MAG: hypothetical protein R2867_38645 [Caldilineaceae bacterium]